VNRVLVATAVLLGAVAVLILVTIPPARAVLGSTWSDGTVGGVLHVHTSRSDGRSTPEEVAAAAARAGRGFVVFTDHGDATRKPDAPVYRSGVLCLDGVEISTRGGHYVAIDMPAAPYPLAGEPRDVIEDVRRLGGFGIAAHPDSPKEELRWREWDAPIDAIELLNPDTSWRTSMQSPAWRPKLRLFASLLDYPFRSPETLASLLQRPSDILARWSDLTRRRRVVGLAGTDAHAKIAPRQADPGNNRWSLPLPSYEASFEMLSVHVHTDRAFTGDAATDAALLMRALRSGHAYTAIDGLATPPAFEFSASNARGTANEGDELGAGGGPVTLRVRSNAPPAFTTMIWEGARRLSTDHHQHDFTVEAPDAPAEYRVEVRSTARLPRLPWILSNPIYVRGAESEGRFAGSAPRPPAATSSPIFDGTANGWRVERDPVSLAALDVSRTIDGSELRLRYALAGEVPAGSHGGLFIALIDDRPAGLAASDRLVFTARAERPMRISVQLRAGPGSAAERWQRSVYVDTFDQERTVYFDDLSPVGPTRSAQPPLSDIHDIMFVIDTTNTKPGSSGRFWIKAPAVQR
jgi:hypothetical protein